MRLDLPQAVRETESQLLKAREELSAALRERDKVDNDLKERRRALSEVSNAVYERTGTYSDALLAVKNAEKERDSTRHDFYKEIDQRVAILDKFKDLDKAHSECVLRLQGLTKQEEALKQSISHTSSLLAEARRSLVDAKTEESVIREWISSESERLSTLRMSLDATKTAMDARNDSLGRQEKEMTLKRARMKEYALDHLGIILTFDEYGGIKG